MAKINHFNLSTYWQRRQTNRAIVGNVVTLPIYESYADRPVVGKFLIFYTDDINVIGLQIAPVNDKATSNFYVFGSELVSGEEKKYHYQRSLQFSSSHFARTVRIFQSTAMGGIVDVDLQTLHVFKLNTPFEKKILVDGNAFDDTMQAFFNNPVVFSQDEALMNEIYNQFVGSRR